MNYIANGMVASAQAYILHEGQYLDAFNDYVDQFYEYEKVARNLGVSKEQEELFEKNKVIINYLERNVINAYENGERELALDNLVNISGEITALIEGYAKLAKETEQEIVNLQKEIVTSGKSAINMGIAVIIITVIMSMLVANISANNISKPLYLVMKRMKKLGSGDLSGEPLQLKAKDETGQLAETINQLQADLKNIMMQISEASEIMRNNSDVLKKTTNEVNISSEQVAATMEELARGAEQQASSSSNLAYIANDFTEKSEIGKHGEY